MPNDTIVHPRSGWRSTQRRTWLAMIGLAAAVLIAVVLALPAGSRDGGSALVPHAPAPASAPDEHTALATRPMPYLPPQAALPQPLSPADGRTPLRLPAPTVTGGWIPTGFPDTPEGALAQLAALIEQGLRGGDPAVYMRAYAELSAPGAPAPEASRLANYLATIRSRAHLPATGPVAGLTLAFTPTHGLIKGALDDGHYVVVCVLGEFTATFEGRTVAYGVGDCQAMAYLPGQAGWRISPGAAAARAPDAWPGSADAVRVGYRDLVR